MAVDIDRHYADYVSTVGSREHYQQCLRNDDLGWGSGYGKYYTNAAYAVVTCYDELNRVNYNVCYGKLNEWVDYDGDKPEYILLQIQSPFFEDYGIKQTVAYDYYSWLFNHSPFSDCFVTKDVGKALKDRVVILTAHIDSSLLIGACSAVRLPWESYYKEYKLPSIVKLWHMLIMEGNNPTIALAVANNFSVDGDGVSLRGSGSTAGHQFLSVRRSEAILNFSIGKYIETDMFSKTMELDDYRGVSGIWNNQHSKVNAIGDVSKFFSSRILGTAGKQVNPFSVSASSTEYKLPAVVEGLTVAIKDIQTILET